MQQLMVLEMLVAGRVVKLNVKRKHVQIQFQTQALLIAQHTFQIALLLDLSVIILHFALTLLRVLFKDALLHQMEMVTFVDGQQEHLIALIEPAQTQFRVLALLTAQPIFHPVHTMELIALIRHAQTQSQILTQLIAGLIFPHVLLTVPNVLQPLLVQRIH